MEDALTTMLPLLAFMLIPIWIPMIAVAIGGAADRIARLRGATEVGVSADVIKARYAAEQPA